MILTTDLLSTWIDSYHDGRVLKGGSLISTEAVLGASCVFSLLPIVLTDPRVGETVAVTLSSIVPFCLALGYLTPRLIDEYSAGDPANAGRSYGVNIAGGILGPLVAAYVLLPTIGTHATLLVLSVPIFLLFVWAMRRALLSMRQGAGVALPFAALFAVSIFLSRGHEDGCFYCGPHEVRRDYLANVIAYCGG